MEVWAYAADEFGGKDICLWSMCDLPSSLIESDSGQNPNKDFPNQHIQQVTGKRVVWSLVANHLTTKTENVSFHSVTCRLLFSLLSNVSIT